MPENNENLNEYSAEDIDQDLMVDLLGDGIFDIQFGMVYESSPVIIGGLNATEISPINVSYTSSSLEVT